MANPILNIDPFTEIGAYADALRHMADGGWVLPRDLMPSAITAAVIPLDILDTGPALVVQTNLPGVKSDQVSISLIGKTLTIKGDLPESSDTHGATYLRRERRAASFSRSVTLPVEVDSEHGEAHLKDGVLTLTLPKADSVLPKNIKIVNE